MNASALLPLLALQLSSLAMFLYYPCIVVCLRPSIEQCNISQVCAVQQRSVIRDSWETCRSRRREARSKPRELSLCTANVISHTLASPAHHHLPFLAHSTTRNIFTPLTSNKLRPQDAGFRSSLVRPTGPRSFLFHLESFISRPERPLGLHPSLLHLCFKIIVIYILTTHSEQLTRTQRSLILLHLMGSNTTAGISHWSSIFTLVVFVLTSA